ncbi:flagellar basal body rod protein FlgB [Zavarzinella formosa]|uniref:flagellar basal body rod protein FlgB n=1 Tax=Zavarzinella formosa TaxID=360055 RepID=UPI0002FEBA75|nr:flagellar basal body protein [Zavarzinella formosa]
MDVTNNRIDLLTRVMDTAALRHKVIANNVANVNTPGFKRLGVEFEQTLSKAIEAGTPVTSVSPTIVTDDTTAERVDGNTVDIDREMQQLSMNSLLYTAASQILANQLAQLRSAIAGR